MADLYTIATPETSQRVREFIDSFRSQSWDKVMQFQEFDGDCNAVEVFAISCPQGKHSVMLVRNPAEFYDSDAVLESHVVAGRSWLALSQATIGKEWKMFL